MKRFKKILLVDGRPDTKIALERAALLAEENDSILVVMEVLGVLSQEAQMALKHPLKFKEIVIQERAKTLDTLIEPLRQRGLKVRSKVVFGIPFIEIIREVLINSHDLVITVGGRREGLKGMFFGNTTMYLMRKCPCPVWAIKSTHRGGFTRILAAIDPSTRAENINKLNRNILQLAASLAKKEGSQLHIVHCWIQPLEIFLRGNPEIKQALASDMIHDTHDYHESLLQECLAKHKLDGIDYHVHLLKGDPGNLIPNFAGEKEIDLVVMGTVCRTGVAGFFIGNTAENVLNQVESSVLTVKPDGFVTPVEVD